VTEILRYAQDDSREFPGINGPRWTLAGDGDAAQLVDQRHDVVEEIGGRPPSAFLNPQPAPGTKFSG
jgi:hypothetical protein